VKVRILGTAAGGGLPQWNCGCATCDRARSRGFRRLQDGLAISGTGRTWCLVNASPDLGTQLAATPELAPPAGTRDSPIRSVLLTSAELDHVLGLMVLRESTSLTVYGTATVLTALPFRSALEAYTTVDWHTIGPGQPVVLDAGLVVHAFASGTKRPRYATGPAGPDWTVAYRFRDERTGTTLVYAPGLAEWSPAFSAGIQGADVVILDGTFATADELPGAAAMGHLSIEDTLVHLRDNPGPEYVFTHLNNTNPYALAGPDEVARLAAAGARVAADGEVLDG
jgi:pyrroloquinoline quinone biosynthesis protein B